jgi:F0F1-type ATP synthase delta subunit
MERTYAQALLSLLAKEGANEHTVLDQFFAHLKARGRTKLLPGILREVKRLQARTGAQSAHVEVAHQKEAADALKEAAQAGIHATHATVNPSLIRGWRAHQGSQLVDRSGKRALIDLYRRITA